MEGKLNRYSTKDRKIINIGTSLMVVVLMGMAFGVIAAISLSSAKNSLDLSNKIKDHTSNYYAACSKAYELLDEKGWSDQAFEVDVDDSQKLEVEVKDGEIVKFKVENSSSWDAEDSLPVHKGE